MNLRFLLLALIAACCVYPSSSTARSRDINVYNPSTGAAGHPAPGEGWSAEYFYDEFDDECGAQLVKLNPINGQGILSVRVLGVPGRIAHLHDRAFIAIQFRWATLEGQPFAWADSADMDSWPGARSVEVIFLWTSNDTTRRAQCRALYAIDRPPDDEVGIAAVVQTETATAVIENTNLLDSLNAKAPDRSAMLSEVDFASIIEAPSTRVRVAGQTVFELSNDDLATIRAFLVEIGKGWDGSAD